MINPTVSRLSTGAWRWVWPVGTPPYAVWLNGELQDTVTTEAFELALSGYNDVPPEVEIRNSGDDADNAAYPPYVLLQWRGVQAASAYLVEQYDGVNWIEKANITEDRQGYYTWQSVPLVDATTYQFRVTALDLRGNGGAALTFSIDVCRNPLGPQITADFSSAGDLVVSEA